MNDRSRDILDKVNPEWRPKVELIIETVTTCLAAALQQPDDELLDLVGSCSVCMLSKVAEYVHENEPEDDRVLQPTLFDLTALIDDPTFI